MYQNKRNSRKITDGFERYFYQFLIICLVLFTGLMAINGHASVSDTKIHPNSSYVLKTKLSSFTNQDLVKINPLRPVYTLKFDLPAHNWYENLEVFLSAYPTGPVKANANVLVSYNGSTPISLKAQGSRFDAHIRLDPDRIRTHGNELKFFATGSASKNCDVDNLPNWVLDFERSNLVSRARAKQRTVQIKDIKTLLANPMTSPKRVKISARGPHKIALEALVAQGVALRTSALPAFSLGKGPSDFEVVLATFDMLPQLLRSPVSIAPTSGPVVIADGVTRPRLILSAANDDALLELARAFASYELSGARRAKMFGLEFQNNKPLMRTLALEPATYNLNDLARLTFKPSWQTPPRKLAFTMDGAGTAKGELLLNIWASKALDAKSKLRVLLNAQSIGYTYLDKTRKRVSFDIPSGLFKASNNQLQFVPILKPADHVSCPAAKPSAPLLSVGPTSKFYIDKTTNMANSDLARFAANAGPFSKNTTIVLNAKRTADKLASLKFLAYSARAFGPKFANAKYVEELDSAPTPKGNILIIGPEGFDDKNLLAAAPRSVVLALNGKAVHIPASGGGYKPQQQANTDAIAAFEMAARGRIRAQTISTGGLASIFASPYENGRAIGIVTATSPSGFSSAIDNLIRAERWNALSGGVVRWNITNIVTTQSAIKILGPTLTNKNRKTSTAAPVFAYLNAKWLAIQNATRKTFTIKPPRLAKTRNIQTQKTSPHSASKMKQLQLRGVSHPNGNTAKQGFKVIPVSIPSQKDVSQQARKFKQSFSVNQINRRLEKTFSGLKQKSRTVFGRHHIDMHLPKWLKGVNSTRAILLLLICLGAILLLVFSTPKHAGYR